MYITCFKLKTTFQKLAMAKKIEASFVLLSTSEGEKESNKTNLADQGYETQLRN